MAKDPICGMTVDEASALHTKRDAQTFYFCSDHCRQTFLTTPAATKQETQTQDKTIYTCPMHPEVQQIIQVIPDPFLDEYIIVENLLPMAQMVPVLGQQAWVTSDVSRWIQFALAHPSSAGQPSCSSSAAGAPS